VRLDRDWLDRRQLLRYGAVTGLGAALGAFGGCVAPGRRQAASASTLLLATPPLSRVRVGVIGVGGMGTNHVATLLKLEGVEVKAICDIDAGHAAHAMELVKQAGQATPATYTRGEHDFERLSGEEDLDLVYIATPWRWHVPMSVAAMKSGKHVAVEVPAAITGDGCWELVETAERTGRHCVMLENCCYDRPEMMCLHMVRKGLLGEVLHGECGYLHDLRSVKFGRGGEGLWRRAHSTRRNANLYPTHGLGPVAQCMNINRGDRFDYLVSMSSPSRGLQLWQQEQLPADDPRRKETYVLGDVNSTLIRTALGKTIYVVHDTNLPRPYSRLFTIQGTKGIFQRWPERIHVERIHVEGRTQGHGWEQLDDYYKEYEHPLWKSDTVKKASGGHGGMDFLESYRLIECLRRGEPTDMNVYDAAAWSVIVELTERSVANRSQSVDVPDFTRGGWKSTQPLGIVG
jgi:Glycosyl hydrolase 109, C-terminal domain/Oxidoreductase family, NAD-binding Rossmann fold